MVSAIEASTRMRVKSYRRINTGWDYVVIIVNERYVFRFPRFEAAWKHVAKELMLTPWLANCLSIEVPRYEFVWEGDKTNPTRFAGYSIIEGEALNRSIFRQGWSDRLGRELGRFLTELHRSGLPKTFSSEVPRYTPKTWAQGSREFYRRVRKYAYPALPRALRNDADSFWVSLLADFEEADFEPVLTHSDLTGGNMIVDPRTGRLRGIIDWEDAQVADPALDFVGSFQVSPKLGRAALQSYGGRTEGFDRRVRFYLKTIPFGELTFGVRHGLARHRQLGLKHLENWSPRLDKVSRAEHQRDSERGRSQCF